MTLRDKMLAVIADVNASVAEREELVEMIAIALLTWKNLFVLGDILRGSKADTGDWRAVPAAIHPWI